MKASNGGHLHTLLDYSHPFLLGGQPTRSPPFTTLDAQRRPQDNTETSNASADDTASGGQGRKRDDGNSGSSRNSGREPAGSIGEGKVWLARRLPRTFLWHGTADATVPFSQSTKLAATLRAIGVPTTTYFASEGVRVLAWCCCLLSFTQCYRRCDASSKCRTV